MDLTSGWELADGADGRIALYVSRPAMTTAPLPMVLVLQEVWGVDDHICDVADRIAAAGYAAIAPDLYAAGSGERPDAISARTGKVENLKAFFDTMPTGAWQDTELRNAELAKLAEADAAAITETMTVLFGQFAHMDKFIAELRASVAWAREQTFCDGRVGAIGFCMGGGLAARLACEEPRLNAAVGFYGGAPTPEQIAQMQCPVLCLHGEQDERLVATIPDFQKAADGAGKQYEAVIYPDAPHAFFNDTRSSYRPDAARPAWAATLAFLNQHLAS